MNEVTSRECLSCKKDISSLRKQAQYCNNYTCQKARERLWKEQKLGRKVQMLDDCSCEFCGVVFHKKSHNQTICGSRECRLKKKKKFNIKYSEKIKKYSKEYYAKNKEELLAKNKEWREKNKHYRPQSYFKSKEYYIARKDKKAYIEYCNDYRAKLHNLNNELKMCSEERNVYYSEWSHAEDLELIQMKENEIQDTKIAKILKRTLFSVRSRYFFLNDIAIKEEK